jgi:hypothetical protein
MPAANLTIEEWIESKPAMLRRLWNPSAGQLSLLNKLLVRHPLSGRRPTFRQYEAGEKTLSKKTRIKSLKGLRINNCSPGFHNHEVKPNNTFNALKDLPEGLALFDMADSGPNHAVLNADRCIWTWLWNFWPRNQQS